MRMNRPKTDGCPRCAVASGSAFFLQDSSLHEQPFDHEEQHTSDDEHDGGPLCNALDELSIRDRDHSFLIGWRPPISNLLPEDQTDDAKNHEGGA